MTRDSQTFFITLCQESERGVGDKQDGKGEQTTAKQSRRPSAITTEKNKTGELNKQTHLVGIGSPEMISSRLVSMIPAGRERKRGGG